MKAFSITLENALDEPIIISQSGKEDYTLQPDLYRKVFVNESTQIDGHSECGSFTMKLVESDSIQFTTWGNITIVRDDIGDEIVFKIDIT